MWVAVAINLSWFCDHLENHCACLADLQNKARRWVLSVSMLIVYLGMGHIYCVISDSKYCFKGIVVG